MSDQDYAKRLKEAGRNDACPCGSGKKYKKCHLQQDEDATRAERAKQTAEVAAKAKALEESAPEAKDEAGKPKPEIKAAHHTPAKPTAGTNMNHKPVAGPRKMV
jgi:hypothetical protein